MGFRQYINESSLSRVYRHILKYDSGVITAFRNSRNCGEGEIYTKNENLQRNKILTAKLMRKGYSLTRVNGEYIENYGSNNEKIVGETSYIVIDINDIGNLRKDLVKLGKMFEQDSILFIEKGGKNGYLIGTNKCEDGYPGYNVVKELKHPLFGKSGEFQTRVNGRPFIMKQKDIKEFKGPQNVMGKWAMKLLAEEEVI